MARVKLEDRLTSYLSNLPYDQHARLTLSPSAQLLAFTLPGTVPILFNLSSLTAIPLPPDLRAEQLLFSADETCLYLRNSSSLMQLPAPFKIATPLVDPNPDNSFSHAQLTPDAQTLVYINHTEFYQVDLQTGLWKRNRQSYKENCLSETFTFDAASNSLVSASQDCKMCVFEWGSNGAALKKIYTSVKNLSCQAVQVAIVGKSAVVTSSFKSGSASTIFSFDMTNLSNFKTANLTANGDTNSYLLKARNYLLAFSPGDTKISLWRNAVTNGDPEILELENKEIIDAVHLPNDKYVLLTKGPDGQTASLSLFEMAYNCSTVKGSTSTIEGFQTDCSCKSAQAFEREFEQCRSVFCGFPGGSPCQCNKEQRYDTYTLDCALYCPIINNALPNAPFSTPPQCQCRQPFAWSALMQSCSLIDCSRVAHSTTQNMASDCACQSGFVWNARTISCELPGKGGNLDFGEGEKSPVGAVVAVLFMVILVGVLAAIYYYKKCRKVDEEEDVKVEDAVGTHRHMDGQDQLPPPLPSNCNLPSGAEGGQGEDLNNMNNFCIGDDDHGQGFSQIESNIEGPCLTQPKR